MGSRKSQVKREVPGGGSPGFGGLPEPGTCKPVKGKRRCKSKKRSKPARRNYTVEERLAAIEAYKKSGMTQQEFARLWGISHVTLGNWLRKVEKEGPRGLERKPHAGKGKSRLATPLKSEIVKTKKHSPEFGLKKIRDYLMRFRGVKVSSGAIRNTLKQSEVSPAKPPVRKKAKKKKRVRRFERAKPGELWQSDITSFVLTRHGTRVYLTVFMDDFSRYVVSFALALHQKSDLVTEALLSGLDRFGKPKEVLTDQGRQYFAWRGKSRFQKLLIKQGIQHVVARSHHPQTVGKCERFWKTVQEEFWSRTTPQVLAEARERLSHFISHYNFHRPHQGIDGLVPADRFFGAESEVRKALEARLEENELRVALGEAPRRSVYLVGRVGDREVSLHGERGKLVIHTPTGEAQALNPDHLGMAQEVCDGRGGDRSEREGGSATQEAEDLHPAETVSDSGEGVMGQCHRSGEAQSASDRNCDSGDVAGSSEPEGGVGSTPDSDSTGLAALPAGPVGTGSRSFEATEEAAEKGGGEGVGGKPLEIESTNCEADPRGGAPADLSGPFEGTPCPSDEESAQGGATCPFKAKSEPKECPKPHEEPSDNDCSNKEPIEGNDEPWPRPTGSRSGR